MSGAPPYDTGDYEPPDILRGYTFSDWKRPNKPPTVGLQVGHWKNEEVPEELQRLRGNTGASGGGKAEWEVNYTIAKETATILQKRGIKVDILPATIPPEYWADVFVAIHADGSLNTTKSGFKLAAPRRDYTEKAAKLATMIEQTYAESTLLKKDPNITRNMTGYYAFAWWRYDHAIHPMTPSVILETGFLTSPSDRTVIVNNPEISANGLAMGIVDFMSDEKILKDNL